MNRTNPEAPSSTLRALWIPIPSRLWPAAALILSAIALSPLHAQPWAVKAYGGLSHSTESVETREGEIRKSLEIDGSSAFGLGLERQLNHRIGLSLDLQQSTFDLDLLLEIPTLSPQRGLGDAELTALQFGLPIRLTPSGKNQILLTPLISWNQYENIGLRFDSLGQTITWDIDDEVNAGIRIGFERTLDSGWLVGGHLQYLRAEVSGVDPTNAANTLDFNLDPWFGFLAVGHRF